MKPQFIITLSIALSSLVACNSQAADKTFSGPFAKQKHALVKKVKSELVKLDGGSFEMGDWGKDGMNYDFFTDSRPLHKVTLDDFYMQAYKVTYEQFDLFTDDTGKERVNMRATAESQRQPKSPAGVNWYGAEAYCAWLGELTGLPFALPTEAQWEYAARSGGKLVLFATDNGLFPKRGKNYSKYNPTLNYKKPLPLIGTYPPNPAGFYAMTGDHVFEWVNDWYDESYYKQSPEHNPQGPTQGVEKVKRGGEGVFAEGDDISSPGVVLTRSHTSPIGMDAEITDDFKVVRKLFTGYSGFYTDTFRCAVNASTIN